MVLRYARDWLAVAHVLAAGVLQWLALAESWWWAAPAILLGAHVMAIEHNHAHLPVFRWKAINRAFDLALIAVCGIPMLFWRVHHLGSHHAHTWTDEDWSSPFNFRRAAPPDRPIDYRYYQLTYYPLFCAHSCIHVLRGQNPRQLRSLLLEGGLLIGGSLALIALFGPSRWLVVMGGSYVLAGLMLGSVNYFEHYGSHEGDDRFLAWTFTCKVHNVLSYNSGYHLLHHNEPQLHWSRLPHEHAADPSYCGGRLIETGLFPGYRTPAGRSRWLHEHAEAGG